GALPVERQTGELQTVTVALLDRPQGSNNDNLYRIRVDFDSQSPKDVRVLTDRLGNITALELDVYGDWEFQDLTEAIGRLSQSPGEGEVERSLPKQPVRLTRRVEPPKGTEVT